MSIDSAPAEISPASHTVAPPVYRAGTLSYTPRSLATLFGWLLWGDFCYTIFQTLIE